MAKTIEQLQAFIEKNPDLRQVVNELADYLQANPPGEGGGSTPTLAAVLAENNDADGGTIENLDDPTTDQQAATKKYVDDNAGGGGESLFPAGTKVYAANLNQSGTSAPSVVVLANTLSGPIVWTRTGVDNYRGTLSGAFTANKTLITPSIGVPISHVEGNYNIYWVSANIIDMFCEGNEANGLLEESPVPILILVFP